MDDTVQNNQHTWAGKDAEPMNTMEKRLFFLEDKLSTLQSENESLRASGNDLLKEKIALKEHMIANLNSYITQLRSSPPADNNANSNFHPTSSSSAEDLQPAIRFRRPIEGPMNHGYAP